MIHNQVQFDKRKRSRIAKPQVKTVEKECELQRAVGLSSEYAVQLAEESARARLINHFVNSPEDHYDRREFASYYRAPTRYTEPPYAITSHTNEVYIPKAPQVIPAYPSLVPAPQWCPPYDRQSLETYSQANLIMKRKYNCRCLECMSSDCPGRDASQLRPYRNRDNIMTFCDQSTMTRNLNDAGCGCTPTSSNLSCHAMSVPRVTSMVRLKNFQSKVKFFEVNDKHDTYNSAPILKNDHNAGRNSWRQYQNECEQYEPPKSISIKCCFREDEDETRKNIYNEGISDVALKFPSNAGGRKPRPLRVSRPASRVSSRVTVTSDRRADSEVNIPHSHRSESRYHKHCVEGPIPMFVHNDVRATGKHRLPVPPPGISARPRTPPGPRTPPRSRTPLQPWAKNACCITQNKPKQRIIKLPKKLLTSERVADPPNCNVGWRQR